ncbi:MAG: hypothetical protein QOG49_263 [Frankiaceae bacterium]|jgi:hypothetical protein|nr:hypothetical protein [Frankiaceae bacterium]
MVAAAAVLGNCLTDGSDKTAPPRLRVMKISEFWRRMEQRFGARYAASVAQDLVISQLGGRTVAGALADGVAPKQIWAAVCEAVDVPLADRH